MAILSKEETYEAIRDGAYKAISEAVWSDDIPGRWRHQMIDAMQEGAYRAVYETEEKRIFGGLINHGH